MITIYTARWLLPITSPVISNGAIAIRADRIVAIGSIDDLRHKFPEAEVCDLGEAAILPGLVNAHTHLELTVLRGRLEMGYFPTWIAELVKLSREYWTPEDLLISARLGCIETIRAGITTVADTTAGSSVLPALIESGQRGIVFQECFGPQDEQASESIAELERKLDVQMARLASAGTDAERRLRIGISPHAPYTVSQELYRRAATLATKRGLDIALHTAESIEEQMLLAHGIGPFGESFRQRGVNWTAPECSTIEYLDRLGILVAAPLLIHCVMADETDLELMASRGARVAHCPKSNAKFGHGVAPLVAAQRVGIRVGLGTDSVASNNTCDLIEEVRFAALMHRAMQRDGSLFPAESLLRLITLDGACALGLEAEIGSLEPGKRADFIAIAFSRAHAIPHSDPTTAIVFSASGCDVVLTVVAGRVLYDGEQVITLDEREVLAAAGVLAARLSQTDEARSHKHKRDCSDNQP